MALSTSILAYQDCKDFLERAVDDPKGARIPFRSEADANYWRMRCNQFRKLDREQNRMIHEIGSKMHGASDYDSLTLTIRYSADGYAWVYARKMELAPGIVENLSEIEDEILEISADEIRMLENHSDNQETT